MVEFNQVFDFVLENFKKIFYPEEWFAFDQAVSKSELLVMYLVARHGEMIMSRLASEIDVPMSTATGIVERLVKNGYIQRDRSEGDRRVVAVKLTDEGKAVVEQLKSAIQSYIDGIYQALTEDERRLLMNVFTKVSALMEQRSKDREKVRIAQPAIRRIEIE